MFLLITISSSSIKGETLSRRAFLSTSLYELNDSLRNFTNYLQGDGVYVSGINKYCTCHSAGVFEGDIITKINNKHLSSTQYLIQKISLISAGDSISLTFFRNNDTITTAAVAKPWSEPVNYDNKYLSVPFDNGHLRAILSKRRDV